MRCDFAEWLGPIPATNYRAGPTAKQGVVHHVIVGSLTAADSEFHRTGSQLSAHFGVADGRDHYPDGHLVQWLDTDDVSYAQVNGNSMYLSVETAGDASTPWTTAQIVTLGRLDAWAAEAHHFLLQLCDHGGSGLTTHCHYPSGVPDPSWGNHPCPGGPRVAQMPQVLAAAQGQQPPPQEADMGMTLVPSWATLKADGRCEFYQAVQGADANTFVVYSFNGAQLDRVDGTFAGQWFLRQTAATGPVVGLAELGGVVVALCDGGGGGVYRIGTQHSTGHP